MKDKNMAENEAENGYPVRTTHEFLAEINKEWRNFKRGAVLSILTSCVVLVAFVAVFIRTAMNGLEVSDVILELALAGFVIYTIYLMSSQYRFFKRWEKRKTRIFSFEDDLMREKLDETPK